MRWLIPRLLIIWLIFGVLCGAAIGVGRLDHTPTPLQTLGFDTCDGDPCFRGLKPGMEWAKVLPLYSQGKWHETYLDLPSSLLGDRYVTIYQTKDELSISGIGMSSQVFDDPLAFTAGEVIALYGSPCRLYLEYSDSVPGAAYLIYPSSGGVTVLARVDIVVGEVNRPDGYILQQDSHLLDFSIFIDDGTSFSCNEQIDQDGEMGPWRGFISADQYVNRNRRDIGLPPFDPVTP